MSSLGDTLVSTRQKGGVLKLCKGYPTLKTERKSKKLSGTQMAKFLGFKNSSTYYKKERQEIPTTISEAKEISKLLGKTIDELFS